LERAVQVSAADLLIYYLVGRNVAKFDVPLSASAATMENELIHLKSPTTDETPCVG
jgi:hypothetical protein